MFRSHIPYTIYLQAHTLSNILIGTYRYIIYRVIYTSFFVFILFKKLKTKSSNIRLNQKPYANPIKCYKFNQTGKYVIYPVFI